MALDPSIFRGLSGVRYALRRFLAASEEISRAGGVTARQYQVMLAIKASEGGELTVSDLAEQLLLTHHAAVQMMNRLEHAGLAQRKGAERDRRVVLLGLTEKGEALVDRLAARHLTAMLQEEPLLRRSLNQLKRMARK